MPLWLDLGRLPPSSAIAICMHCSPIGADADRYSFTVVDLHLLLFAGFDRRTEILEFRNLPKFLGCPRQSEHVRRSLPCATSPLDPTGKAFGKEMLDCQGSIFVMLILTPTRGSNTWATFNVHGYNITEKGTSRMMNAARSIGLSVVLVTLMPMAGWAANTSADVTTSPVAQVDVGEKAAVEYRANHPLCSTVPQFGKQIRPIGQVTGDPDKHVQSDCPTDKNTQLNK